MPFEPAKPLVLRKGDQEILQARVRKRTLPQRDVFRAQIILYCADGLPHREIKRRLKTSVDTVIRWRNRYAEGGVDALQDLPRPGRPSTFSPSRAT